MPPTTPRTITASALSTSKPAACKKCGTTEPRKDLWGINARGATTASLVEVDHWLCQACFIAGGKPRLCMWIDPAQDPTVHAGYVPSLVSDKVAGHRPMVAVDGAEHPWHWWVWGATLAEAEQTCDAYNRTVFGLSKRDASAIVASAINTPLRAQEAK